MVGGRKSVQVPNLMLQKNIGQENIKMYNVQSKIQNVSYIAVHCKMNSILICGQNEFTGRTSCCFHIICDLLMENCLLLWN